ncbi:MAG: response regulator [Nitrosomonas sp.]|nr:response regulator [Nitrosomonas sp.]MBP6075895.1 response regulator [Nitrosomonas sp.]
MRHKKNTRPGVILMIDDNPTDVLLIKEAFTFCQGNCGIYVAEDGVYAIEFLKRQGQYLDVPRPDIILLDLNMPRKNGFEVLMEVKTDSDFKSIPIIIYTSSVAKEDIRIAYHYHANGYIRKSADFDECIKIARSIQDFWFSTSILYEP